MSKSTPFVRIGLLALLCTGAAWAEMPAVAVPRFTHTGAGQTFYFVLTDRFANGSEANDRGGLAGGSEVTGFDPTKISHYQGGDFVGLTAHLDYLKALGVTAVWVTPPFKNKPMQQGTAGYHGYWITDFLQIDPHLGTNEDYRTFIREAHARGLRVYMDIIVNHTADVVQLQGDYHYQTLADAPYRDANGQAFDVRAAAFNGLGDPAAFPVLAADRSFPYQPGIPAGEEQVKNPAWLNDVTLYHNRGNTTFVGENSTQGDFVGLDDVFTEDPRAVRGFIEIFQKWQDDYGIDGYRIDTVRHVNAEFWQAFSPAIRAHARELGRSDFVQFGEIYNDAGDPAVLSEFSTNTIPIDTSLDFGFFAAARRYVSQGGTAAALADLFARDDFYTDHDSNVHTTTTFLGNHDAGRFGYFLQQDNPGASPEQLAELVKLGHGLLYLSRGQPVLYYGDEQGMIGRGGNDMQARESVFASQAPDFRDASLLATTRTGADDKFDAAHPFYQFFAALGELRANHAALRVGAHMVRLSSDPAVAAFSRIGRDERVEYLAVFNNSRTATVTATVPTSQPAGATLQARFASQPGGQNDLVADSNRAVTVTLPPLQFAVWQATAPLDGAAGATRPLAVALVTPAAGAEMTFTAREVDGLIFPSRREIRAEVTGGDGFAEVTFAMARVSRPGQMEWLGTDDTPPYRVFWAPPADLEAGDGLTFFATVSDLRGGQATSEVGGVAVAPSAVAFGIRGSTVPVLVEQPPAEAALQAGTLLTLTARAEGTGPLEYQWLRDGELISGATDATLAVTAAGRYVVMVHNLAGTTLSAGTDVVDMRVGLATSTGDGAVQVALETYETFASAQVAARRVDVWLPPGYARAPERRWPVVYMQDGQNLFDPALAYGGQVWAADVAMGALIAAKRTEGAIIVGIWNTGLTRFAEYMPQQAVEGDVLAHYEGGATEPAARLRSDAYLRFLVEELKPFVDRTYRTQPEPAHTSIMGSSMGGLISVYALVQYPAVFGAAAGVSTHWPAGGGAVIDYVAEHLPAPGAHRLYFDFGTETLDAGYEPYQRRMDAAMGAAGYTEGKDWVTYKFPGAAHAERSWRERVDVPLAFVLAENDSL